MVHFSKESLVRLFGGKAALGELDRAAEHLAGCKRCWGLAAKVVADLSESGALAQIDHEGCKAVIQLIETENDGFVQTLAARAWWAGLQDLDQTERLKAIRKTKSLQSWEMLNTLLAEASAQSQSDPCAAEETAMLAMAVVEVLERRGFSEVLKNELRAEIWTVVGNCRRLAADWRGAAQALQAGKQCLEQGTEDPLPEARLLSIQASLATDTGKYDLAVSLLRRAREIYTEVKDRQAVARIAIQHANLLRELEPEEALRSAEEALILLGGRNARLEMYARSLVTESLIELGRTFEAMRNLRDTRFLYEQFLEPSVQLRVRFLEARILEQLECHREAEKLFEKVAEGFWEAESYQALFMVRLHLFAFHLARGALHKAAAVCRDSIEMMTHTAPVHEQMRKVWQDLLARVEQRRVDVQVVRTVREYMVRHWRVPAARSPLADSAAS